jgi:predicted Zn-dependent peptidase
MNRKYHEDINETVFTDTLPNGLQVYIVPKNGFNKTYVSLTAPFGSNITKYKDNGTEWTIPYGVAHFLEHKLFEIDGKDISEKFSQHSAHVNAFTTNNRTSYLFSATDHLFLNIETLCDFVLHPQFTEEGIKKEMGIITQEINMYDDDPNNRLYMGLLKNMYPTHPVSLDILGTEESINTINKDILSNTHKSFYNPHQMVLFITGKVDVEETITFLQGKYSTTTPHNKVEVLTEPLQKPTTPFKDHISFDVLQSNALLGITLPVFDFTKTNYIKKELSFAIFSEIMFGKGTKNYQTLLEKELINDTFGTDITLEEGYSFMLIGGNTNNVDELYKEIQNIIDSTITNSISPSHFKRILHQIIGGFINSLNSIEYIANQYTSYLIHHTTLFDMLEIAKSITIEDIETIKTYFTDKDNYHNFTVYPK